MNCNCSNWDDESPCKIHGAAKLPSVEIACHYTIVVRIYRRRSNKKWFYTVARDAIQQSSSRDCNTLSEIEIHIQGK